MADLRNTRCKFRMASILLTWVVMRIAISFQQDRVSPVFDVAGCILIVDTATGLTVRRNQRTLAQGDCLTRALQVSQFGVEVLICGAISWPLENALSSMGVQVIACICGPVEEVITAFLNQTLAESAFIMPGCLARRQRLKLKKEDAMEKPIINYESLVRMESDFHKHYQDKPFKH